MAKVYAVLRRYSDGDAIFGIFSDRAGAEVRAEFVSYSETSNPSCEATIVEYELDNPDYEVELDWMSRGSLEAVARQAAQRA